LRVPADGRYDGPEGPCLSTGATNKRYGYSWHQLEAWEAGCPYHPAGRLVPVYHQNRLPGLPVVKTYRIADLDEITERRRAWHDGVYDLPGGRRFNLAQAVRRSGFSRQFFKNCFKRCEYLPEGRLVSVMMRPPRPRARREHTILEKDLLRLQAA